MAEQKVSEEKTWEWVNFETRIEVLEEEMWTTAAIPLSLYTCVYQQAVISTRLSEIESPDTKAIFFRQFSARMLVLFDQ